MMYYTSNHYEKYVTYRMLHIVCYISYVPTSTDQIFASSEHQCSEHHIPFSKNWVFSVENMPPWGLQSLTMRIFFLWDTIVLNICESVTGGDHKMKHFACHRDFIVHTIPGIKYFKWLIRFSTNEWL